MVTSDDHTEEDHDQIREVGRYFRRSRMSQGRIREVHKGDHTEQRRSQHTGTAEGDYNKRKGKRRIEEDRTRRAQEEHKEDERPQKKGREEERPQKRTK